LISFDLFRKPTLELLTRSNESRGQSNTEVIVVVSKLEVTNFEIFGWFRRHGDSVSLEKLVDNGFGDSPSIVQFKFHGEGAEFSKGTRVDDNFVNVHGVHNHIGGHILELNIESEIGVLKGNGSSFFYDVVGGVDPEVNI
jgi:hypothetical protein